jgi:hypothetical protein
VTLGVALNMMQMGLAMGLPATLVPQLKESTSSIPIDDDSGSWVGKYIINISSPQSTAGYRLLQLLATSLDLRLLASSSCQPS